MADTGTASDSASDQVSNSTSDRAGGPATDRVLDLTGIDVVRQGRRILAEVTLRVRAGEHWALLGPNGAGKSTLLSLCGAVIHPTSGTVEVLGRRIGRVDMRELRAWIGFVHPRQPLDERLSVEQAVMTGATGSNGWVPRWKPTVEQLTRADELMELLGVVRLRNDRLPTLSQGERGRMLIARALMPEPHLLLLDEPSTGLDLAAREQLLAALDTLRAQHPTLATVLVTHHLEELPASTTHALLLRGGRTLHAGPATAVLNGPNVSEAFGHPVVITRQHGRWNALAAPVAGGSGLQGAGRTRGPGL